MLTHVYMYLRINTIMTILFVLVTLSMEGYGINETQTILFPKDVSVGKLKIGHRKSHVEARGSISVPFGEKIELNVHHEFAKKLHKLPIFQEDILLTIKFENLDMGNINLSPLLLQKKLIGLNFKNCKSFSEKSYRRKRGLDFNRIITFSSMILSLFSENCRF